MKFSWHLLHLKTGVGGLGTTLETGTFTGGGVLTEGGVVEEEERVEDLPNIGRGLALLLVS